MPAGRRPAARCAEVAAEHHSGRVRSGNRGATQVSSRDTRKPARVAAGNYDFGRGDLRFAPPELLWGLGESDDFELMARGDLYLLGSLWFEVATGVGLTSLALGNPLAVRASVALLPEDVRRRDFQARTAELRE
jgi:hypothetical protein